MDRGVRDSGIHQPDESINPVINSSSDDDSESSMPNDDPPAVPRPQQLANIPIFDGERGEGFINWLEALENAGDAYGWATDNLVGVAKARGGPKIVEWMRGLRLQGITYNVWATDAGLRQALLSRFGPKYTSATAVHSVSDLKQRHNESCASFHYSCVCCGYADCRRA